MTPEIKVGSLVVNESPEGKTLFRRMGAALVLAIDIVDTEDTAVWMRYRSNRDSGIQMVRWRSVPLEDVRLADEDEIGYTPPDTSPVTKAP